MTYLSNVNFYFLFLFFNVKLSGHNENKKKE